MGPVLAGPPGPPPGPVLSAKSGPHFTYRTVAQKYNRVSRSPFAVHRHLCRLFLVSRSPFAVHCHLCCLFLVRGCRFLVRRSRLPVSRSPFAVRRCHLPRKSKRARNGEGLGPRLDRDINGL